MLEKLTLDAALGVLKKVWPFLVIVALGVYIMTLQHRVALDTQFRESVRTELSSKETDRTKLLRGLHAAMQTSQNRAAALAQINQQALEANQRSTAADKALAREQEANARKFAASQRQIHDLMNRRPTGNAQADCAAIEEDSKAAWKGWK